MCSVARACPNADEAVRCLSFIAFRLGTWINVKHRKAEILLTGFVDTQANGQANQSETSWAPLAYLAASLQRAKKNGWSKEFCTVKIWTSRYLSRNATLIPNFATWLGFVWYKYYLDLSSMYWVHTEGEASDTVLV